MGREASTQELEAMNIGVDGGNHGVKTVGPDGEDIFLSEIGEYRDIVLKQKHGDDDMIFEYRGKTSLELPQPRRGFAGSLAKFESEFGGSIMGGTKAHEDGMMRILLALHRYTDKPVAFNVVTSNPLKFHTDDEKQKIKEMLLGEHILKVNGKEKVIRINKAEVSPEGAAAFWVINRGGLQRIIDAGGGTVNLATLLNKKYIDRESDTLPFGMESTKTRDASAIVRATIISTSQMRWGKDDPVSIFGGTAKEIQEIIKHHYPKAEAIEPEITIAGDIKKKVHPVFGNAAGNYEIAKRLWK